ncbi:MAG: aspartate-semialdehyde dehydrogenase [Saprospiraceae bacterium]|nr:aspartate-semialdehyde dehydrogenase [Saprospiraceae bacterium]
MRVAVVGVTGLVGTVMNKVLEERGFPISEYLAVASERSVGKKVVFRGEEHTVIGLQEAVSRRPDLAIFSAGGSVSLEWAPRFAEVGTTVVDNSSAWRMDPGKKLIVPEINAHELTSEDKIIANPNCSTIQMVMALSPLHKAYGIDRIVVSTYQSITGTGVKAVRQYEMERKEFKLEEAQMAYHYPIFNNCIPHCDSFLENDYTKEEMKLVHETRKILGQADLRITATAVRVPVQGGHSEAVNVSFHHDFSISEVRALLEQTPGISVVDDPGQNLYPMPLSAQNKDDVFVGRLRRDESNPKTLNCWIVSDNLRKGAATNAVQIAEFLASHQLVGTIHV